MAICSAEPGTKLSRGFERRPVVAAPMPAPVPALEPSEDADR
jgi:hypothetical protein